MISEYHEKDNYLQWFILGMVILIHYVLFVSVANASLPSAFIMQLKYCTRPYTLSISEDSDEASFLDYYHFMILKDGLCTGSTTLNDLAISTRGNLLFSRPLLQ